ncbi:hypothetical protein DFH06DRAFT_1346560 [Mycena polygramma]|nr:hypothetical protein DFH06DRAFT_1346560 [Mycena polygramma]
MKAGDVFGMGVIEELPLDYPKIYYRLDAEQRSLEGRLKPYNSTLNPTAQSNIEADAAAEVGTPLFCYFAINSQDRSKVIAAYFPRFPEEILPNGFSWDWGSDDRFWFVRPEWYDLSPADTIFTHAFKIPGKPRPIARSYGADVHALVNVCGAYYLWDADHLRLHRYGSDFKSDEDFLRYMKAGHGDWMGVYGMGLQLFETCPRRGPYVELYM